MKYILLVLVCCFSFMHINAQAPQGIPYQSVIRNGSGVLLINQAVQVRFSIHDSTMSGNIVYQETHTTTTSAAAMVILTIGQGTVVTGNFSTINWGNGAKFMQVELDATGGNNYVDLGTQQMMSVPYALYAGNGLKSGIAAGEMMYWNGTEWVNVAPGIEGQTLRFHNGMPIWESYISIGFPYQGGIIAYILQSGDPGYDPNVLHGLIVAPYDQGIAPWSTPPWSQVNPLFTNISYIYDFGAGNSNTNAIVALLGPGNYAAKICYDLVLNGYSDWYLPSYFELVSIYSAKGVLGLNSTYWSSTADVTCQNYTCSINVLQNAFVCAFSNYYVLLYNSGITSNTRIRAVRSF